MPTAGVTESAGRVVVRRGPGPVEPLRQSRPLEPFTAVLIAVNKRCRTRSGVLLSHVDVEEVQ